MSSFHGTFRLRQFNRPFRSVDVLTDRTGIPSLRASTCFDRSSETYSLVSTAGLDETPVLYIV